MLIFIILPNLKYIVDSKPGGYYDKMTEYEQPLVAVNVHITFLKVLDLRRMITISPDCGSEISIPWVL